jgi:hypothetical protein
MPPFVIEGTRVLLKSVFLRDEWYELLLFIVNVLTIERCDQYLWCQSQLGKKISTAFKRYNIGKSNLFRHLYILASNCQFQHYARERTTHSYTHHVSTR